MRRLEADDIKNLNLMKHYRIIRKWACRNNDLNDADLELLIYLDCIDMFRKKDFEDGAYSYSWDNRRWNRLLKQGWIVVWRHRNRTEHTVFKIPFGVGITIVKKRIVCNIVVFALELEKHKCTIVVRRSQLNI